MPTRTMGSAAPGPLNSGTIRHTAPDPPHYAALRTTPTTLRIGRKRTGRGARAPAGNRIEDYSPVIALAPTFSIRAL